VSEVTRDAFFDGKVSVIQPKQGYRAGTDSILLATALPSDATGRALEMGCGAGGALFPAMFRLPNVQFTGIERDKEMATLARRGIKENNHGSRVEIIDGDAGAVPEAWQNAFDLVFSNPPFFETGAIKTPGTGKESAYLESVSLKHWINAMLFVLRPKGTFVMVHRAADLARILAVLERQTGDIGVLPIHSYPGSDAKRVLVRARKGLRPGPLRLLEPRYLHLEKGGDRTDWAYAVQQSGTGIDWN